MNRESMMKAYAVLIVLVLILFGLFAYNKAFVGKNLNALGKINHVIEAAGHPTDSDAPSAAAPANALPTAAESPAAAPPAVAAAPTDAPTPEATPAAASELPAKGGLGSAMKNIREKSDGQRKLLENSLNSQE